MHVQEGTRVGDTRRVHLQLVSEPLAGDRPRRTQEDQKSSGKYAHDGWQALDASS